MKGSNHKKTSILLLLAILFILGYQRTNYIKVVEFSILYLFFVFVSPDIDLRFPFNLFLKHRGLTHNPLFIIGIFSILYYKIDWVAFSFLIAWTQHIVTDRGSTKIKRVKNKLKRVIPF